MGIQISNLFIGIWAGCLLSFSNLLELDLEHWKVMTIPAFDKGDFPGHEASVVKTGYNQSTAFFLGIPLQLRGQDQRPLA